MNFAALDRSLRVESPGKMQLVALAFECLGQLRLSRNPAFAIKARRTGVPDLDDMQATLITLGSSFRCSPRERARLTRISLPLLKVPTVRPGVRQVIPEVRIIPVQRFKVVGCLAEGQLFGIGIFSLIDDLVPDRLPPPGQRQDFNGESDVGLARRISKVFPAGFRILDRLFGLLRVFQHPGRRFVIPQASGPFGHVLVERIGLFLLRPHTSRNFLKTSRNDMNLRWSSFEPRNQIVRQSRDVQTTECKRSEHACDRTESSRDLRLRFSVSIRKQVFRGSNFGNYIDDSLSF